MRKLLVRDRKKKSAADYKVFLCVFLSVLFQLPRNTRLYGIFDVSMPKLHEIKSDYYSGNLVRDSS